MKLALVNTDENNYDPPLGLCYIASYLRKYMGFENVVIVDKEDPIRRIRKERPDIVGITAASINFLKADALAENIKTEFDVPTIIGGVHITALPNQLQSSNFSVAVLGEGEQTMLELMQCFEKNGLAPDKLGKINGMIYRNGNTVETTGRREFIKPLDTIPYPARDLLNMDKYLMPRASVFRGELTIATGMLTSRGCPYRCVFCASKFWERTMRLHSAEYVVGEIKHLIEKYRVDHIIVWDDLFVVDKKRVQDIHDLIKSENMQDKVSFIANGRANVIDDNICKLLSEISVKNLSFGFESGSPDILKYLKQGSVTVEQNRKAIEVCKKYGINVNGFFVMGAPPETERDLRMTMDFVRDQHMDAFSVFQLVPFPATDVWEYAKSKGIVSDETRDFSYAQLARPEFKPEVVMNENMSAETLRKWYFDFQAVSEKRNYKKFKFKARYLSYLFSPSFISKIIANRQEIAKHIKARLR